MRHGKYFAFGLILCVFPAAFVHTAAAQDIPRPKKDIPKLTAVKRATPKQPVPRQAVPKPVLAKKIPAPEALAFDPVSQTTFIIYDIGTLRMMGKSPADATYAVGTLRMTGRADAAIYPIGTLSMSGMREP